MKSALFWLLGIVFWFTGVLFIRLGGATLFVDNSPWLLALFALALPVSWLFVKILATVGQVRGADLLNATVVASIAASTIDGIVLTWFPTIYAPDPAKLLLIAAWLLWGIGIGLCVGYWQARHSLDDVTNLS
ncbi:MAG: DUF5367 family protein [Leptolyngbyaceae bacterium]|nr:DUF5367 family protein [Leptolyngbyaceae bacterium]